ncbi:hypothetical protein J2Z21_005719 [Streptomyces griseochromogenes]|uniref:Knr4/Smi1-like domain-containing protein n=1 Tax=Streptomyces griseochromogenes TaxID=68214 RepID=A0A1B1B9Z5_9ACTN|nr:SMI1/KNR4 family protein [Streptomyces griseochromogenes]ANP55648.1 hypothetical protein AVL59_44015 [Streptomyces griseochromogenes]MBP2052732.1 hypothetical protein [Streptomyces griseochromogenes]
MTEDELIEAVRAAVADRDLPPPAAPADVVGAERAIGSPMPRLLRRLYLEVANGGFGIWPCVSLTDTGRWYSDERDLVEAHRNFVSSLGDPGFPPAPPSVVPLMDRGCCMWTLIDLATEDGRIWDWDPDECCVLVPTTLSLSQWLTGWLEGWVVEGPYDHFRTHDANCPSGQRR